MVEDSVAGTNAHINLLRQSGMLAVSDYEYPSAPLLEKFCTPGKGEKRKHD